MNLIIGIIILIIGWKIIPDWRWNHCDTSNVDLDKLRSDAPGKSPAEIRRHMVNGKYNKDK